ncbi:acyltransferase family protein [Aquabacterium sp.]|uniref:acyltransferase family protein n=1 Tax=Aquabacterium sp. TaxID=1872578 RepID=UPI003D00BF69
MDIKPQLKPLSDGFRTDINGLRAWAVMAVVLYHFGVPGFKGGFVGVDIFFVISGFLMTGIIVKGISRGSFSFIGFYLARAKRIIPALLAVCITLLTLGWFFLPSTDYKTLASHSVYSLFFLSNIEYWLSAGYFDAESHEKWLLHTWSLSVEWQFYMLLPLILWAPWKLRPGKRTLIAVLTLLALLSFGASTYYSSIYPTASFYLLHTRAWELIAGGLIWLMPAAQLSQRIRYGLTLLGLAIIGTAIATLDKDVVWPGAWAALPVIGTSLVIWSQQRNSLTHHPIAQWLGDRSYSLYLWHWPVFVTLVLLEQRYEPVALAAGIVMSILLGALSYRWIEQPTRVSFSKLSPAQSWASLISAGAVVSLAAIVVWKFGGFPARMPDAVEFAANEQNNTNSAAQKCHIKAGVKPNICEHGDHRSKVIIVGDSHAQALVSSLKSALPDHSILQAGYGGCPFIEDMKRTAIAIKSAASGYDCTGYNRELKHELNNLPREYAVILVGRYAIHAFGLNEEGPNAQNPQAYFTKAYDKATPEFMAELSGALTKTACNLAKERTVFMLRPIPEMGLNAPRATSLRIAFGLSPEVSIPKSSYWARNSWVWKAQDAARDQCGIVILDGTDAFCDDTRCYGTKNGRPIYFDDDHLSEYGNKLLVPTFQQIPSLLQAQRRP